MLNISIVRFECKHNIAAKVLFVKKTSSVDEMALGGD